LAIIHTGEGKVDGKVVENFWIGHLQGLNQWQTWKECDLGRGWWQYIPL